MDFQSINPATGEVVWRGKASDVNLAVASARKAFPSWDALGLKNRIPYLEKFAAILKNSSLAETISKETGKPLWESKNEVSSMIAKVNISIEAYAVRCPEILREQTTVKSITRHKPHGVIAVLGPFNFPGHLPNGHIIPALLAGNTIVFKPSELTPLVGETILKCWEQTGIPKGVINLVQGAAETGKTLSEHPDINGLLFTGSASTGLKLSEYFGKHPEKILALEMGGNNPLIIGNITDYRTAAFLTIQSSFITSGQRCTCARRLILTDGVDSKEFLEIMVNMVQKIRIGPYTDTPEPYIGPVISEKVAQYLLEAQTQLISKGATPLLKMKHLKQGTGFVSPGILDMTNAKSPDTEYFGPLLQVFRIPDFNQAIKEGNNTQYGLAAGLLSDSREQYEEFYRNIQAGVISWNTQLTGASSAAPFGGIRRSGNFRPSAYYAADYCAYPTASQETETMQMPVVLPPGLMI